ncbi:MAG TPA: DUF971 domain-containing protein [Gemmatales bacterium]|nr:DUF971 domain-containing protein [Gemmatales bacterium]HMP58367.1 DUF971 domain-containing protein [Gemmatales bacterium]
MTADTPKPVRLRRDGDRLIVDWSDGQVGSVSWATLREQCPCAGCREERAQPPNPFRILKPEEMRSGKPEPTAMVPVGYYAYKITWQDGHDTGIYTFEALRAMCDLQSPPETEPSR